MLTTSTNTHPRQGELGCRRSAAYACSNPSTKSFKRSPKKRNDHYSPQGYLKNRSGGQVVRKMGHTRVSPCLISIDGRDLTIANFSVEVKDISLTDYIQVRHAVYLPHTAGRYAKKQFKKAQMPIVERLVDRYGIISLCVLHCRCLIYTILA